MLTGRDAFEPLSEHKPALCELTLGSPSGTEYILMGGVDEDGRGTLSHGAFTALYKPPHGNLLTSIGKQPC